MTLREHLYGLEGAAETERQIGRGLHAWAVERWRDDHRGVERCVASITVFGTCPSDAVRRACSPARLGDGCHGDRHVALEVARGWDEPIEELYRAMGRTAGEHWEIAR